MGQKVDSKIIDVNGFQANDIGTGANVREGGVGIVTAQQIKQIDGDSYITSWYNAAVANAGVLDIRIVTLAARKIIFHVANRLSGVRMRIYENPTIAGGTLLAAVPPEFSANLAVNFAWHTPVVTANGTLHFDGIVGAVDAINSFIYTFQSSAGGFSYLVRFTNIAGAANDISINMETFV